MKLAVIGSYGHVGEVLGGLEGLEDVELAAAARWGPEDPVAFVGRSAPAELPVFDDYRRMLDKVAPDIAAVFMPFHRLAEASMAAVEHGCHVFSEKPLATTLEDLGRLRELAGRAGVEVVACLAMRGSPACLTIRRAVREGRIGRPIHAVAQKSYPFASRDEFYKHRRTYGGTIPWVAIHALDYIKFCMDQDYRRVAAIASNQAHPTHPGMEDQGGLIAELSGGGVAVVNFDYLRPWGSCRRPWGDNRLRIAGTEGILETKDCGRAVELMTPESTEMLPLEPERNLFADFVGALSGRGEGLITSEESFRITEVVLKAREAQDRGQFVEL
ncbi:MAG: hypothetical protein B1H04_04795 [Planctomycetales bacterium 4484_123]|nr:MAG: hypothetical protein B1H04_04795 [Planctomycetales bacterium 4484_123]